MNDFTDLADAINTNNSNLFVELIDNYTQQPNIIIPIKYVLTLNYLNNTEDTTARQNAVETAVTAQDLNLINFLIQNQVPQYLFLAAAINSNDLVMVSTCLSQGIGNDDSNLYPTIDVVIQSSNLQVLQLMIDNGIDASTLLGRACYYNNINTIDFLISKEAYLPSGAAGAIEKNNQPILDYLLTKGLNASEALNYSIHVIDLDYANYLLDNGAIPNSQTIFGAVARKNLDLLNLYLQKGATPGANIIPYALAFSTPEIVKTLLNNGATANGYFSLACEYNNNEIIDLMLVKDQEINPLKSLDILIRKELVNLKDQMLAQINDYNDAIKQAASFGHSYTVQMLANLGAELNGTILGITNTNSRWSSDLINILKANSNNFPDFYILPINKEHIIDEKFMSMFDGLINPGTYDNYPRDNKPFSLSDLNDSNLPEIEKLYQKVIDYAEDNNIPYLGFSSGSQYLALKHGASLKRIPGYFSNTHNVSFVPGTIPYMMTLSTAEQQDAISKCIFPAVTINNIYTAHNFAIVENSTDQIVTGSLSEEGVIQSISHGTRHIGIQVYPEYHFIFNMKDVSVTRERNIFENFIKLVVNHKTMNDYAEAHNITEEKLHNFINIIDQHYLNRLAECASKNPANLILNIISILSDNNLDVENYLPTAGTIVDIFN